MHLNPSSRSRALEHSHYLAEAQRRQQWHPNLGLPMAAIAPYAPEFSAVQAAFAAGLLSERRCPTLYPPFMGQQQLPLPYRPYGQYPDFDEDDAWEGMKYEPGDKSLAAIESVIKPHDANKRRSRMKKRERVSPAMPTSTALMGAGPGGAMGMHVPALCLGTTGAEASVGVLAETRADRDASSSTGSTNGGSSSSSSSRNFVPDDARAHDPRVLERLFNGVHRDFAERQYRAVCREDCVMVTRSLYNPFGPNYREVHGIASIIDFVDALNEAIPDNIFTMKESKFQKKSKDKMCIVTSFTIHGHIIYKVHTNDYHNVEDIDSAVIGLAMLTQPRQEPAATADEAEQQQQQPYLASASDDSIDVKVESSASRSTKRRSSDLTADDAPHPQQQQHLQPLKKKASKERKAPKAEQKKRRGGKNGSAPGDDSADTHEEEEDGEEEAPLLAASLRQIRELNSNTPAVTAAANQTYTLAGTAPADARNQLLSSLPQKYLRPLPQPIIDTSCETAGSTDVERSLSSGSTPKHVNEPAADSKKRKKKMNEVMIVAPNAKFHLSERIDLGCSEYNVKGTMTLMVDSNRKIYKIDMLNAFDTASHRERTDL